MLFIFSLCELVKFPKAQSRTFSQVCANDKYYENSIFEFENEFQALDDSDDGINNTGIIATSADKDECNYHVNVSQQLKYRTLAFINRIRWLTGYERNLTWDDSKDNETCQCSFIRWVAGRRMFDERSNENVKCMQKTPKWKEGCTNSNRLTVPHSKMSTAIFKLYNEIEYSTDNRNLMLSPNLTKTTMCTVSQGKHGSGSISYAYFTMNPQYNQNITEELPFVAAPPPGFIPYYMMPSVVSLLAKDIKDPQKSEIKIYYNGKIITNGEIDTQHNSIDNYHGYSIDLTGVIKRNYSHLSGNFVNRDDYMFFFPPGSVFGFEATNNGKTYSWNTTLVDCTKDASEYQATTISTESSNIAAKIMTDSDNTSSQKSGLSQKQKVAIGVGVTVGVAAVAGAVVGGLVFAGVLGGGSSVVASGATAGTSALSA